jgi:hypothetical protein
MSPDDTDRNLGIDKGEMVTLMFGNPDGDAQCAALQQN